MPPTSTLFEQVAARIQSDGVPATLDLLETHFRREKDFFRLFEVLKLRVRDKTGLPLMPDRSTERPNPKQQKALDDGILDACQTVGTLLFRDGSFQHGWMYLQPAGNRKLNESLIREVKVNAQNIDLLIDISLNQGAAPDYGYQLMLGHYGTCDAITAFGVQSPQFDRETQTAMASQLLRHIYDEVVQEVKLDIEKNQQTARSDANLRELLAEHPWLVEQQSYHLDATHLSSLMKIARLTTSAADHELALELAEYGAGFPEDLQYKSTPPLENTYPDHQLFFEALLGKNVEAAVTQFEQKCDEAAGTCRVEVIAEANEILIDFLYRIGKVDEAIARATTRPVDPAVQIGLAPDPTEMAQSPTQFETVLAHFQQQDDLLSYSAALIKQNETTANHDSD